MINRLSYFLQDFRIYLLILLVTCVGAFIALCRKPSNFLVSLTAAIASLVFIFVATEAYFRYVYEASDGIGFLKIAQKWHSRYVVFNGNYRRDKEFTMQKSPGEIRIGAIGDSLTFGIGIENPQDRFTNLLETKLRRQGFNASVYNLGISGTDTNEQIIAFHQMEVFNFDIVVWEYFMNDVNSATTSANARILIDSRKRLNNYPAIKFITDHSFFVDFLYWRLTSRYDQTFKQLANEDLRLYNDPTMIRGHQAQISQFIQELRQKHIPIIVSVFPLIHSEAIRQQSRDEYQLILKTFQEASPDALIDLDQLYFPYPVTKLKASKFDHHPNEFAHQIAAEALYSEIKRIYENH